MASRRSFSKRLVASYVLDWLAVAIIGALAAVFSSLTPHYHDFSVLDLSISYPLKPDTVTITVATIVAAAVPAVTTFLVVFLAVPGPVLRRRLPGASVWALKLWEWHAAWLGLAMSVAVATMVTQGLKNFGKPRPNCLARCIPDLNAIQQNMVGGYGQDISDRWVLVAVDICQQADKAVLKDGFQSWPSGHSSLSWSGLLYLSLFLAAKFSLRIPYTTNPSRAPLTSSEDALSPSGPLGDNTDSSATTAKDSLLGHTTALENRYQAAGPPAYLIFLVLVPCGAAAYIALSRWMDYAHHGFDVLSGSLIGIVSAYVSFRWYNPAISAGGGFAWGPRSPARAFGIGVGSGGYVDASREHDAEV